MDSQIKLSDVEVEKVQDNQPSLKSDTHEDQTDGTTTHASLEGSSQYLTGWRLKLTSFGVLLCLYLVNVEVTIVGTSLLSIANDLHGFYNTAWIVTGYLITYTGFIIIWSKLSDVIGRKVAINATMLIFVAFSAGCGGSKSMTQLIICRAFQGIGAAGAYSMTILTVYEMVPKSRYALYGALVSVTIALATVTGPVFGGLIANHSTWRWVFYFNLPTGATGIALLIFAMPNAFGSTVASKTHTPKRNQGFLTAILRRLDFIGAGLLLSGSVLLVTALVEASNRFAWSSGAIISMLVLSALSWISFLAWEWYITDRDFRPEPIFPWRFFLNLPWMGMLLTTFFVGVPFNVVIVSLPQRFQAVNGTSALGAGVRLIPYSLLSAICAAIANILCAKKHVPPIYFLIFGGIIHTVGLGLLSTLPSTGPYPASGYGYQALAGAGVGTTFGILVLTTPFMVEKRDLAVATGAIIQFRFLGGAIGLGIAASILNDRLKTDLRNVLSPSQLSALLQSTDIIGTFTPELRFRVQEVFGESYGVQFKALTGFAAAQTLAAALLWKRKGGQFRTVE